MTAPLRRTTVLLFAAVMAATGLAACSSAQDVDVSSTAESEWLPEAEGTTEYPLTIDGTWGEVEIPERPQRIAVTSFAGVDAEILASLGAAPVAAPPNRWEHPWVQEVALRDKEVELDAERGEVPLEKIGAANPDLIIALNSNEDDYNELSRIAPTIGDDAVGHADWREYIEVIGEALDLSDRAQEAQDEFDTFFEDLRETYPEFAEKTVSQVLIKGGNLFYNTIPGSEPERLFTLMGFSPNPLAAELPAEGRQAQVSLENIHLIDADIVVFPHNEDETIVTNNGAWKNLEAVKNNSVVRFDSDSERYIYEDEEYPGNLSGALGQSGHLGTMWTAAQLLPMFDAALNG